MAISADDSRNPSRVIEMVADAIAGSKTELVEIGEEIQRNARVD